MDEIKEITVTLPNNYTISATIPASLDVLLVELSLRAVVGGLVAVSQAYSDETRREYLIRFVASILNEADSAAKSTQMFNRMAKDNSSRIIDDLLKSIHKEDENPKK